MRNNLQVIPELERERVESGQNASFDSLWRKLTTIGNQAFEAGDAEGAKDSYDLAHREARRLFTDAWVGATPAEAAAAILLVSASNAARNHDRHSNADAAFRELSSAARIFMRALESPVPTVTLKHACARYLGYLLADVAERCSESEDAALKYKNLTAEIHMAVSEYWKQASN